MQIYLPVARCLTFLLTIVVTIRHVLAKPDTESEETTDTTEAILGSRDWTLTLFDDGKYPNTQCLDGTPAGYWFSKGSGDSLNKYVIHHQGGGWCVSSYDCTWRAKHSLLGSSKDWRRKVTCPAGGPYDPEDVPNDATPDLRKPRGASVPCHGDGSGMQGLLSYNSIVNPLTYNWNKVYVPYCDGGSHLGDVEDPVPVSTGFYKGNLHFRGRAIIDSVYDSLIGSQGMNKATDVIISGSSAGGLTVILHVDRISAMIRDRSIGKSTPRVVGVADAGIFLDIPSYDGQQMMRDVQNFKEIYTLQNVKNSLNQNCLSIMADDMKWKCMLPQYIIGLLKTPMFFVQSITDTFQWQNVFNLKCKEGTCKSDEIKYLKDVRKMFYRYIHDDDRKYDGYWVTKCLQHTIVDRIDLWNDVLVNGKRLGESLIDWYNNFENTAMSSNWRSFDAAWESRDMMCQFVSDETEHGHHKKAGAGSKILHKHKKKPLPAEPQIKRSMERKSRKERQKDFE